MLTHVSATGCSGNSRAAAVKQFALGCEFPVKGTGPKSNLVKIDAALEERE